MVSAKSLGEPHNRVLGAATFLSILPSGPGGAAARTAAQTQLQTNACLDTYPTSTPRCLDTILAIFVGIWGRYARYVAAPRKPSKFPVEDTPKIRFGYGTLFDGIFMISRPSCVGGYVWSALNRSESRTIGIGACEHNSRFCLYVLQI